MIIEYGNLLALILWAWPSVSDRYSSSPLFPISSNFFIGLLTPLFIYHYFQLEILLVAAGFGKNGKCKHEKSPFFPREPSC